MQSLVSIGNQSPPRDKVMTEHKKTNSYKEEFVLSIFKLIINFKFETSEFLYSITTSYYSNYLFSLKLYHNFGYCHNSIFKVLLLLLFEILKADDRADDNKDPPNAYVNNFHCFCR